jgi:hypothetical protein
MAYHVLINQNGHVLATVVNCNGQTDHIGRNHRPTRPGFNRSAIISLDRRLNFFHQVEVDERAFF